jgi:AcrR family transcriptional regulator
MAVAAPQPAPTPGSAAWWRWHRQRPRRASALTAERIVEAALRLLDAEGLDALTMRRLAAELGSAAGSIYRHFESREAVLVAVHDRAIGESLAFEPPGRAPEERVANFARGLRLLLRRRPYLAELWRTTQQLGPNALRARERGVQLALDCGLEPPVAARAYLAVLHYTVGFCTVEHGLAFLTPEDRLATERLFAELPPDSYPATRSVARELARLTLDEEFELGLSALTAGLAVR